MKLSQSNNELVGEPSAAEPLFAFEKRNLLNRLKEDVQVSAGVEETERSLWGWSLHRVLVAILINADQNKFGFEFDNSCCFLKYVMLILK